MTEVAAASVRRSIRRLRPETVARIAAGEVVERPASVVKELVENAIDAGATRVDVRLLGGGRELVEVADDGLGIPPEELDLAVERHATSKLAPEGPLDRIASLGFRGEALASIAAVARLAILSRAADSESAHGIEVADGSVQRRFEAGRAVGTTIEVRDLFHATPARRKFLKGPAAELVAVVETLDRLYLAHPEVGVSLTTDGREALRRPPSRRLVDAVGRVLGAEFLARSLSIEATLPDGTRVHGLLGRPELGRPSAEALYLTINDRPIRSRAIAQAVRLAFQDHLPKGRYPSGALHLTIPVDRVDVNVHPNKTEVRIARERELLDEIRRLVRTALLGGPMGAAGDALPVPVAPSREAPTATLGSVARSLAAGPAVAAAIHSPGQRHLDVGTGIVAVAAGLGRPGLRILGPVFDLYWVAEASDELWLIDQHAASERLLYDRLRTDGRLARQELVEPAVVTLTARQRAVLVARRSELEKAGFVTEPFGESVERLRAVPAYRGHTALPSALPRLLDELADGGRSTVPDGGPERIAASIACHAAVRGGDRIAPEALRGILQGLDGLSDPSYACPHGRPIAVRWSRGRLDRSFLRSGDA